MITASRRVAQNIVFTKFLCERDCLTASFTRLGAGFTPPSVLAETRAHLDTINSLYYQMEKLALASKDSVVKEPSEFPRPRSCCGD